MPRAASLMAACLVAVCFSTVTMAETLREAEWIEIGMAQELPGDLTAPEGRTRWDLTGLELGRSWVRTLTIDPEQPSSIDRIEEQMVSRYIDPTGGDGAERWLLPVRDPLLLEAGGVEPIALTERTGGEERQLRITARRVGLGWVHLPSGPREVVLQRALLSEGGVSTLIHRWIDPRAGVVAEVWGPSSPDGRSRLRIEGAALVGKETTRAWTGAIYADQTDHPIYTRLAYGYDRGPGIAVSALTPDAHATIGDLVTATSWDFSGTTQANSVAEVASTTVPINAAETCSYQQCGFTENDPPPAIKKLGREDKNFDDLPNLNTTTSVTEREDRMGDVTIWMRGGVNKEGQSGGLGDGESRLCYQGGGRTEVPLWRFSHWDAAAGEYYMTVGDSWSHTPFACENNIFNHVCPNSCGLFCPIYISSCSGFSGTQSTTIINEGPVTLPSGHTFNALVLRSVAEFCAFLGSSCGLSVDQVRTVIHLWEVPYLGTVARLMSDQVAPDFTTYTTLAETDIKFGLFPPLSVTIDTDTDSLTDTSMQVSWNPGTELHRIDGYNIYWDSESGGGIDGYDFSMTQPAAGGTSVTIEGLDPDTEYFVTVTSLSDFTDPASGIQTQYESLLYPMTIEAGTGPLPVEASVTTTCRVPIDEIAGLTVDKAPGAKGTIEICWVESTDICQTGYQIIGAETPESDANFSPVVEDTGQVTCQIFNPTETYFLVLSKGSGGTGVWGHYDR